MDKVFDHLETGNVQQHEQPTEQIDNHAMTVKDIVGEAVAQPTAEEQTKEQLRQMLRATRIRSDTEVPPEEYALEVDEKGIFALRDIHAIKAKQKAGKTTALKVFIAALLLGAMFRVKSLLEKPRIVFFDTEQSRTDTKLILEDVARMTELPPEVIDSQLSLHSLRRIDQEQLLPLLEVVLEDEKPQVVMLDGIVEFVASFNDETESKQLIKELLKLSDQHNCAIICVLHTNKADEDHNMRGHLGTMLAQKSATVLECVKEKGSSVITVKCSEARHEEMPEWSITFDSEGHIIDADEQRRLLLEQRRAEQQLKRQEAIDKEKKERLETCLRILTDKGGVVSRKQLTEILVKVLNRKRPTVSTYITEWLNDGSLVEVNGMIQVSNDLAQPF
ncbi:MAG: AAA family ATPase [Prevotella sp.]|nr:AAA family ATPase [Prevotella sp.]